MRDTICGVRARLTFFEANIALINAQLSAPTNLGKKNTSIELNIELWDALSEEEQERVKRFCVNSGWGEVIMQERGIIERPILMLHLKAE